MDLSFASIQTVEMSGFDDLLVTVKSYSPEADTDLLKRAYEFSSLAHTGQTRRSGEQYITHPLEVAGLVADCLLYTSDAADE